MTKSKNQELIEELFKFFVKATRTDYRGLNPHENVHILTIFQKLEKNVNEMEKKKTK